MAEQLLSAKPSGAYVYAIIVDGVVRYVGKGRGSRSLSHVRTVERLAKRKTDRAPSGVQRRLYGRLLDAFECGAKLDTAIIADGMSDDAAYQREITEIASAPAGQLWNILEGGIGITSAGAKSRWDDPEYRERRAAAVKEMWNNNPRLREERGAAARKALAAPDVRKRISEGTKEGLTDEVLHRRRQSQLIAAKRPEVILQKSVSTKKNWTNPEYRARVLSAQSRPEVRARMSAAAKARIRKRKKPDE